LNFENLVMTSSADTGPDPSTPARTVLVTGATGKVGRHVVAGLVGEGVHVRALVRHPASAGLPGEVELVEADLGRPEAVRAAAQGADAAFLLWPGFESAGAAEVVSGLAEEVDHIVYLSAARLQRQEEGVVDGVWAEVEDLVVASGADWTFVRAGGFAANTLDWGVAIRAGAPVRVPYPLAARSLVHERDIAEVAIRALLDPGHTGRAYAVTGPDVLSVLDQVSVIGEVIGRPVVVEAQPVDEARRELAPFMGPEGAELSIAHWATLVDSPERATDDVERVTGRPARGYATWVRDHIEEFTP
jgi:uncharacterized protein YbjT (DUF2867 family)